MLAAALMLLASCSKSDVASNQSGDEVSVSFTAYLVDENATKASGDGDGVGAFVDQCRLQVWKGEELYIEEVVPVKSLTARFDDIVLHVGDVYDFLFWADNRVGAYYRTDNLTKVTLTGSYVGGKDSRDAFYASMLNKTIVETFAQKVELHRPFGQLNVITNDIPVLNEQIPAGRQITSSIPDKVMLKVTAPSVFDVRTGIASLPKDLSYSAPLYSSPLKTESGALNTMTMDYLFAPVEEGHVIDVQFSAQNKTSGLANIDYTFTNIPLRRNCRTNVIGSLITAVGTVTVEIKPGWN